MRRSSLIFLAAILLPSLALAWMTVRSARDQQVVLEHQQAIISQDITDALAKMIQQRLDDSRTDFIQTTEQLLKKSASPQSLAKDFNTELRGTWDLAEVGFAVNLNGAIYSPMPREGTVAQAFRNENDRFLSNRENVEVFAKTAANRPPLIDYQNAVEQQQHASVTAGLNHAIQQPTKAANEVTTTQQQAPLNTSQQAVTNHSASNAVQNQNNAQTVRNQQQTTQQQNKNLPQDAFSNKAEYDNTVNANEPSFTPNNSQQTAQSNQLVRNQQQIPQQQTSNSNQQLLLQQTENNTSNASQLSQGSNLQQIQEQSLQQTQLPRQVVPQKFPGLNQNALSNSIPEESDFRRLIGSDPSGALARFREDKLRLMVWYRPPNTSLVFGAQLSPQKLIERLEPLLQSPELQKSNDTRMSYCLALLDDRGKPVATSKTADSKSCTADWKHPLVATEIGEGLPHWEAALYLTDPEQLTRSASTLRLALASIVTTLVVAILLGGWLMAADVRRQMNLAQQKTDFVSNVSHELKTPLTSIRMFADMLAEGRVADKDKQGHYLRIISAESARLTRLINNVLVFARMERGTPAGEKRACNLTEIVRDTVETCRPHFESASISLALDVQADTLPLLGERDALAQIILNLLSNAEKYGGKEVQVTVRKQPASANAPAAAYVDVLDRGPGIPAKQSEAIFDPFRRLDDSLASGVSGSGLGLTLARRMARAHGGDITYSPRAGGGSCFTLFVPLTAPNGAR